MSNTKTCRRCGVAKTPGEFRERTKDSKGGKKGELTDTCNDCMIRERDYRRAKRKKAAASSGSEDDENTWNIDPDLPAIPLNEFRVRLRESADGNETNSFKFAARVDCALPAPITMDTRERAEAVARLVGEETLWHWA